MGVTERPTKIFAHQVILVTFEPRKDPGFSFPCEANPEFDFDKNAESERGLAKFSTEYMAERFAKPVPLFSMVYTNILIGYSRILRSCWIGLITVFDATLTGRQSGPKLQCLYGNSMANNFFQN